MFITDTLDKIARLDSNFHYYERHGWFNNAANSAADRDLLIAALLTFRTREEYLAWVSEWKKAVIQHVGNVRLYKSTRKQSRPSYVPGSQTNRLSERGRGRALYLIRQYSKELAGLQRAENKLATAVVGTSTQRF